ncbi:porin [Methylococcaceae bacterium WWC4]|nr:porin [Methylococcaceae bacterium WWC4]
MKHHFQSRRTYVAGILALCSASAGAESWTEASGLLGAAGLDPNEAKFMKDHNLKIGGWLETSVGANMSGSHGDGFNGPVTFNDRTGEVQLNQLYLYLQKAVTVSGDSFDIGGRVDFMYGTDAIFTQAYGTAAADNRGNWDLYLTERGERFYSIALPQAYAELNLPFGNGVDVKIGHFYTIIGYEVVTSPDNFFVTKPYTMQYGEPFTHTGVLASYAINSNWSVSGGAVTGSQTGGWDGNFDRGLGNWAWLGGVTWTSDDAGTSLAVTSTAGHQAENNSSAWSMYSVVGKHNFTDKLHYIIQHDHGFADNVAAATGPDAEWYGINQYLIYDVNDKLSGGLRAEWFRDHNGFRVNGPGRCYAASSNLGSANFACPNGPYANGNYTYEGSGYYAVTAGLSYKPAKWLNLRPNIRYDFTDKTKAFDNGQGRNQLLFTADVVVTF